MTRDDLRAQYLAQMVELLPEGPAWEDFRTPDGAGYRLLAAKADAFAAIHDHFDTLMAEALPWNASQTLAARETEAGLPDSCTSATATTQVERRAAVKSKWSNAGFRHRALDFEALATSMGYSVAVETQYPFRCGQSRCGVDPLNPPAAAFTLHLTVQGHRKTRFQCGISQIGVDPLCKIQRADDYECRARKLAHSHVNLIIDYEE